MPAEPTVATPTVENYLKGIYALEERHGETVTTTALAEQLGVTVSSVSGMARRLAETGLVDHHRYGVIGLTAQGQRVALSVVRRHRLVEAYLAAALGYAWDEVHDEAEVLEHAVSERLVERMDEALGHPTHDPHGDPIPTPDGTVPPTGTKRLSDLAAGAHGELRRVADSVPGLLGWLSERGISLGDRVEVVGRDPLGETLDILVGEAGAPLSLGARAASSLEITLDDTLARRLAPS